jgi:hypothetical protein
MTEHELREWFSLNVQTAFSILALALIGAGAIFWNDRVSLFLVLAACLSMIGCGFVQQDQANGIAFEDRSPSKVSQYAAKTFWYLSFAFGFAAFAFLN